MYNRYIPQQDGSYKRKQEQDMSRPNQGGHKPPSVQAQPGPSPVQEPLVPPVGNIGGFLKRLIPKDFDTGDLIVVLLLLLMAGDKPEDKSTALLTLALYCFL